MKLVIEDGGQSERGFKAAAGDCVCRAVAIACGLPYREVHAALAEGNRLCSARSHVFKAYMASSASSGRRSVWRPPTCRRDGWWRGWDGTSPPWLTVSSTIHATAPATVPDASTAIDAARPS